MSKKGNKKSRAADTKHDPPELQKDFERKQEMAYKVVRRAMLSSQMNAALEARDDLLEQKATIEAKIERQSQDQSGIHEYLTERLASNYIAIAELESKVSEAHRERLQREKELKTTAEDLQEQRKRDRADLLERLNALGKEFEALKDFEENASVHAQKLKDLEGAIADCKEAFNTEMASLNLQIEQEWENTRKEVDEQIKVTKKAAAVRTEEQLGPRIKHIIAQNKKMMSELRFQCLEVGQMQQAREGLLDANRTLLGRMASARHGVQEMARRSHLLQRIIHSLRAKGKSVLSTAPSESEGQAVERRGSTACDQDVPEKLTGVSEEERQEVLDLREELRKEEAAVAATQVKIAENEEAVRRAEESRKQGLMLRADLARILAWCHEDPYLGTTERLREVDATQMIPDDEDERRRAGAEPGRKLVSEAEMCQARDTRSRRMNREVGLAGEEVSDGAARTGEGREGSVEALGQARATIPREMAGDAAKGSASFPSSEAMLPSLAGRPAKKPVQDTFPPGRGSPAEIDSRAIGAEEMRPPTGAVYHEQLKGMVGPHDRRKLPPWPEDRQLPTRIAPGEGGRLIGGSLSTRELLDTATAKAVARLFLSKLQVSVEVMFTGSHHWRSTLVGVMVLPRISGVFSRDNRDPRRSAARQRAFMSFLPGHVSPPIWPSTLTFAGSSVTFVRVQYMTTGTEPQSIIGLPALAGLPQGPVISGVGKLRKRADEGSRRDVGRRAEHVARKVLGGNLRKEDGGDQLLAGVGVRTAVEIRRVPSDRQATGMRSWDILERAVRRTKRKRTREAACQTLTYRELRDSAFNRCWRSKSKSSASGDASDASTRVSPASSVALSSPSLGTLSTVSMDGNDPAGGVRRETGKDVPENNTEEGGKREKHRRDGRARVGSEKNSPKVRNVSSCGGGQVTPAGAPMNEPGAVRLVFTAQGLRPSGSYGEGIYEQQHRESGGGQRAGEDAGGTCQQERKTRDAKYGDAAGLQGRRRMPLTKGPDYRKVNLMRPLGELDVNVLLFTVAEEDPKKRRRPPGGSGPSGVASSTLSNNRPPSSLTPGHSEALGPSTLVRAMNSKLTAKVEVVVDSSPSRSDQHTLKLGDIADDVTEVGEDSKGIADDRCTLVDGVLAGV